MRLSVFLVILPFFAATMLPAVAQNGNAVAQRQQAMKDTAQAARAASQYVRGEQPFDPSGAASVFRSLNESARLFATLFPEGSETGGDTKAAPAIWDRPSEFEAANTKFIADTQAALENGTADLDSFKASFAQVSANCQSCHQQFRLR